MEFLLVSITVIFCLLLSHRHYLKVKYLVQEDDATKPVRLELSSEFSTMNNPLLSSPQEVQPNIHRIRCSQAILTLVSLFDAIH